MLWGAHNGEVEVAGSKMAYARFGHGPRALAILPGLSDGLATVRGKALLLAPPYSSFLDGFTVYMFSRADGIAPGTSIDDMAEEQACALGLLGITRTCLMGVSQGGMIAQALAASHPGMVERLVLAVTAPCCNDLVRENVCRWVEMAERGDHAALMRDTAERSYSDRRLATYRRLYPVLGLVGRPRDGYRRFLADAGAILAFDARGRLADIACPTLVIGGERDKVVGAEASRELHEGIAGSRLHMYEGLGHAAYEEAPDYNGRVLAFLTEEE